MARDIMLPAFPIQTTATQEKICPHDLCDSSQPKLHLNSRLIPALRDGCEASPSDTAVTAAPPLAEPATPRQTRPGEPVVCQGEVLRKQRGLNGLTKLRLTVDGGPAGDGSQLRVLGNRKAVGMWQTSMPMRHQGFGRWTLDLDLPQGPFKFKLMVHTPQGKVMAETAIREIGVPSAQLGQALASCYFNVSCTWGVRGVPVIKAMRLPLKAHQANIQTAELQVAKLEERQARVLLRRQEALEKHREESHGILGLAGSIREACKRHFSQKPCQADNSPPEGSAGLEDIESLFSHSSWSGQVPSPRDTCQVSAAADPSASGRGWRPVEQMLPMRRSKSGRQLLALEGLAPQVLSAVVAARAGACCLLAAALDWGTETEGSRQAKASASVGAATALQAVASPGRKL